MHPTLAMTTLCGLLILPGLGTAQTQGGPRLDSDRQQVFQTLEDSQWIRLAGPGRSWAWPSLDGTANVHEEAGIACRIIHSTRCGRHALEAEQADAGERAARRALRDTKRQQFDEAWVHSRRHWYEGFLPGRGLPP
jgi:hypothetical protein